MKFQHILSILAFCLKSVVLNCPEGRTFVVKKDNSYSCEKNPRNCSMSFQVLDEKMECAECDEGYYSNQDNQCAPCYPNCNSCVGPNLDQCEEIKKGYYFDSVSDAIRKC